MLNLTNDNYYSLEADQEYMSYSQYKSFLRCEAAAMAKLKGEWKPEPSSEMLVGSFVHSAIEGISEEFKKQNPEIFTQKGELRAPFKVAENMVAALQNDVLIKKYLSGEKERIFTGYFAGCNWKAKLDVYNQAEAYLTELKTVRSLTEKIWDNEEKCWKHFVEAYGYIGQVALYRYLSETIIPPDVYMVLITKEDPPDKAVISFAPELLEQELEKIEMNMPRILEVKSGKEKPYSCGKCDYCRGSKQLLRVLDFEELSEVI